MASRKGRGGGGFDSYEDNDSDEENEPRNSRRGLTKSLVDGKPSEEAVALSSGLGGLALTEKEAAGFIFANPSPARSQAIKWAAVGKVFSPRSLNLHAFERAMQRAWGLHGDSRFKT